MKKFLKHACTGLASATMLASATAAQAADGVNVAFFLEWATPNQIAKVDKAYDEAMGVDVNWTNFGSGVAMTEAMLSGDIDIAYSQGLAPFVTAIQQGAPLKMVAVAVVYPPNDCFVRNDLGITSENASELEGKTIAVPYNTMADFSFRKQMEALDVDIATMTLVDQLPADGAASLNDGSVDMACIYGGDSAKIASQAGTPIMSAEELKEAGIGSFDVISVTEKFASENPDLLRTFLEVTDEANAAWVGSDEQFAKVAADAGMNVETTKGQMATFTFPSIEEQMTTYFGNDGVAASAAESLGAVFVKTNIRNYKGSVGKAIDSSFLE